MADKYLHEDIFSKDMIRSMKEQMVPSDDVINSLLAAISSEVSFDTQVVRKRRVRRSGFSFRAASKYIAAVAAALVMIVGTISILGNGDGNKINEVISSVVDNPTVVTTPHEDPAAPDTDNAIVDSDDEDADEPADLDNKPDEKETGDEKASDEKQTKPDDSKADKAKPDGDGKTVKPEDNSKEDDKADGKNDNQGTEEPADPSEDPNWVKEVLAVEAPQAVLMGESYELSDAAPAVSGSDAGSLVFRLSQENSEETEATYKVKAKKIKKVSPNIMVGVKIPDTGETLIYINRDYAPSTLGEFLKDSGITGHIDFSTVVYTEKPAKGKTASSYSVGTAKVGKAMSNLVFSQSYAETIGSAINNREDTYATLISSRYQNPLGLDIKFEINQNGHLYINLSSGNAFTFYIGEDQTDELLNKIKPAL